MERREFVCIRCPLGCMINVEEKEDGTLEITGNTCSRGAEYAAGEMKNPVRTVTSTVRVRGSRHRTLPVKTRADIPKARVMDCVRALKEVEVEPPVHIGDVILANAAGTGVDVVASKDVLD